MAVMGSGSTSMKMQIGSKNPALSTGFLACVGLIMALILLSAHGPGLSTDAVNYLATADHLAVGGGFTSFEGGPYVLWPPLYPLLLAIPRAVFGLDPLTFGAWLNAIAFAAAVFLTGTHASRLLDRNWLLSTLAAAAVLLSSGIFAVSVNIGSDPLFIVFMLSFFMLFERYSRLSDRPSFAGMVGLCALACIQRYIGATIILAGSVGVLYIHRKDLRRGWFEAATFVGLSALPLLLWMARNYNVSGTPLGVRDPSTWRPDQNLQDITFKALRWFIPNQLSSQPVFWLAVGVATFAILLAFLRRRRPAIYSAPRPITLLLIAFSVIYLLAAIVLTKSVDHKNIPYDDRLYLPAFFSLLLLGLIVIQRVILPVVEGRGARIGRIALIGASLLWLTFPANGMYKFWLRCLSSKGIAYYNIYNLPTFRDSDVTHHLEPWATDPNTTVFSNYPAAVYLSTRRDVKSLPARLDFFGTATPLQQFVGVWPGGSPAMLVWFEPNTKRSLYSPLELSALARMQPVFTSDDGTIYRIQPR